MKIASFPFVLICFILFLQACGLSSSETAPTNKNVVDDLVEKLNEKISSSPDDPSAYFSRGEYYYEKEVYSEAIRDLIRCIELDSSRADCPHLLADSYLDDNRSRPAMEVLEDYLKLYPKDIPTLLKISEFQIFIKKYKPAHFHLNNVLKQDETHALALFQKGLIYHYEEKPIQAVEYLQRSIQSDPDMADGHLLLGQIFEEAGNPLARKYYENAIRVDEDNPEAKMALANYYWMSDNYQAALASYQNLLTDHPTFDKAHFNKGLIYLELDSLDQAILAMEAALTINPRFILAHYYLGEGYFLKGDYAMAKKAVVEASKLSPSDPKIAEKIKDIEDAMRNE